MKILMVDDNESLYLLVAVWLARAGGFDLQGSLSRKSSRNERHAPLSLNQMSEMGMFRHLFHLQEVENPLAVRNDAANGVLPGLLPYGRKQ
jgi:hypothetical protein